MAVYLYVKSGGTATADAGRYTSLQTGTFASLGTANYYPDIITAQAATDGTTSGTIIFCSHLHSAAYGNSTRTYNGGTTGPVIIVSVDDDAIDSYKVGAKEATSGGSGELRFAYHLASWGLAYESGAHFRINSANSQSFFHDCTLSLVFGSTRFFYIAGDGCAAFFRNSTIDFNKSDAGFLVEYGGLLDTFSGAITNSSGGSGISAVTAGGGNGGAVIRLIKTDVSDCDASIVAGLTNGQTNRDLVEVYVSGCRTHASLTEYFKDALLNLNHHGKFVNSAGSSDAAEYQFQENSFYGTIEDQDDTGIHRDESTAYPSGTKASLKVVTNSNAGPFTPLEFEFPMQFVELSDTASDVITIYFASTATLTDKDIWATLVYPDGTNKHIYNYLSNQNANPIGSGTTHTDDSGSSTWKNGASDLTAYNEYRMALDTTGDAGADGLPDIHIHVGIASTTIYIDTTIGLS